MKNSFKIGDIVWRNELGRQLSVERAWNDIGIILCIDAVNTREEFRNFTKRQKKKWRRSRVVVYWFELKKTTCPQTKMLDKVC